MSPEATLINPFFSRVSREKNTFKASVSEPARRGEEGAQSASDGDKRAKNHLQSRGFASESEAIRK